MNPEQLAAAKSIVQHAAVNSLETDEVMLLGHALQEIDRLRSAPVAVEVPEIDADTIRMIRVGNDTCQGMIRDAVQWAREHVNPIPPSRILKDGRVQVPVEEWEEMRREISAWRDATKANERTKALHIGEYSISLSVADEDGEESGWDVTVPWATVKDIMAAIRSDKSRLCALRSGEAEGRKG